MKILELFSGYGTATFALKRLGIPHEIIGYSDIDKYANMCFWNNHWKNIKPLRITNNTPRELGDVKLINPNDLEDFDLLTGGFPCQSFSVAGKGLGELDPRGTLFYEIIRIAEVKKPKYMLLENVKGLTNKTHKATFDKILSELDRIGYKVYWKVLNSKDYGIPQSRARVWFVCFRKPECCGKIMDLQDNNLNQYYCDSCCKFKWEKSFKFPEPVELKIFIKDILEPQVDSKYYLSPLLQERFAKYLEEKMNNGINRSIRSGGKDSLTEKHEWNIVAMRQRDRHGLNEERGQQLEPRDFVYDRNGFSSRKDGFKENELSPTLSQKMGTGGNNVPMVQDVANTIKVGGRVTKPNFYYEKKQDNFVVSNTITQAVGRIGHSSEELGYIENNMKCGQLRRLTPKECFRLMGFLNDEINLEGLSDTQRYKLAGNGQDVNMVSLIFKKMFPEKCGQEEA